LGLLSRKAARKRVRENKKQLRIKLINKTTTKLMNHRDIRTKETMRPM
jgi:hypothetical protein